MCVRFTCGGDNDATGADRSTARAIDATTSSVPGITDEATWRGAMHTRTCCQRPNE
jgi:hypothetical protein